MLARQIARHATFRPDKHGKADLLRGDHLYAGLNTFEPGQVQAVHSHAGQDKLYYVVEGTGVVEVGGEVSTVHAGDLVLAPSSVPHGLVNPGPARLIVMVVFGPPPPAKPAA